VVTIAASPARTPRGRTASWLVVAPALAVAIVLLVVPLLLMVAYSFWRFVPAGVTDYRFTLTNYGRLFGGMFYLRVAAATLWLALEVTLVSVLVGYPVAYLIVRRAGRYRAALAYLLFIPLMLGIVVRAYGWMVILGRNGLLSAALQALGLARHPVELLYTHTAVLLGLVEVLLPFAVMPMISAIEKINPHVEEAARVLGAGRAQIFRSITLPLSQAGIVSGALLVFSLSFTAYALPALLGGGKVQTLSAVAYDTMLVGFNYPFGSAIGVFMIAIATAAVY
jgi:putative spermidine/putrescine transport system permease protein